MVLRFLGVYVEYCQNEEKSNDMQKYTTCLVWGGNLKEGKKIKRIN